MIETADFNTLILNAFTGKTTWLWASQQYPLGDFIDTFHRTRASMQKTVDGLTDGQAAFHMDGVSTWSLSETITHLVFSQGFYHNALLDISDSGIPHITEAARGFGEGGRVNVPADELRTMLREATILINDAIEKTRITYDPALTTRNRFFGEVTYATWILLLTAHEVDHVRQSIVMRRYARTNLPGMITSVDQGVPVVPETPSPTSIKSVPAVITPVVQEAEAVKVPSSDTPVSPVPSVTTPTDQDAVALQESGSGSVVTP